MARVSQKHPSYRTKEIIARDVAFVLNAPLSYGTQQAVLNNAAWTWTEFDGKVEGCRYWSVEASGRKLVSLHKQVSALKAKVASGDSVDLRALKRINCIHEHAVPRKVFCQIIRQIITPSAENVFEVCERLLQAAIVTDEEDKRLCESTLRQMMPTEFFDQASQSYMNPWLRYSHCGITLVPKPPNWPT